MDSSDQQIGTKESMQTPKLHGIIFGSLNSEQVDYGELHRLATVAIDNLIDAGSTYDQISEELKTIRIDLDAVEERCDPEKVRRLYDLIAILVEETAERLRIPREIALQKLADAVPIIQPVSVRKSPSAPVIAPKEDERGVQATIGNVRSGSRALLYVLGILAITAGAGTYLYKNKAGEAEAPIAASTSPAETPAVEPAPRVTTPAVGPAPRVTTPAAAVAPAPQAVPPAAAVAPAPQAVPPAAAPKPQASTPVVASPVPRAKVSVAAVPKPRTEIPAAAPKSRVASKLPSGTIRIPIVVRPSAISGGFKIDTNASRAKWEAMGYKVSVSMGLNGKIIRLTDAKGDVYEVATTNLTAETANITAILQSSK